MIRKVAGIITGLVLTATSLAAPVMTSFQPETQGLHFVNRLTRDLKAVDITWPGYCGGMVYTALDYFNAHKPVPKQDWCPATGTVLEQYTWDRQTDSVNSNVDKWLEVILNPAGARDTEFFDWGLQTQAGSRIAELKQFIDRGIPVPLGLKGAGGHGDHQVLAIGYDMGRYNGSNPQFREDFKIFCYNPNFPDRTTILKTVVAERVFQVDGEDDKYRTWFVNRNYHAKTPPTVPSATFPNDNKVHMLVLTFKTGIDDMRGGGANVDVTINGLDGTQQKFFNVNRGQTWIGKYSQSMEFTLRTPISPNQIKSVEIFHSTGGGLSPDNWDLKSMNVRGIGGNVDANMLDTPAHRFTDSNKQHTFVINTAPPASPGMISDLVLEFKTSDDDLRGGNDNLDIILTFDDNTGQRFDNVNRGLKWDNNSTHRVTLTFNKAQRWNGVKKIVLVKNASGGFDGDNWNMSDLKINATLGGTQYPIGQHGYNRFTGDAKQLVIMMPYVNRPPGH